jgi:hypothetical protein
VAIRSLPCHACSTWLASAMLPSYTVPGQCVQPLQPLQHRVRRTLNERSPRRRTTALGR